MSYTDADLRRLYDEHGRPRPLLLWVGRFLDFKRVPYLLHAFAGVCHRLDPAPVLLMWGGYPGECEGTHPAQIAADLGIENAVFFAGWRGHDELPTGLNCADLMVAPAVNEPFGMVYLEAMACGTPPIATSSGGPRDTIIPAGSHATGWHTAPDDVADLTQTLVTALTDTAERKRRSINAVTHVRARYDWSHCTGRYSDLYDQAIQDAGTTIGRRTQSAATHPRRTQTWGRSLQEKPVNPIKVSGLLLDMNGLFRRWHNVGARTGEQISGLPEGTLDRYAYGHPNYRLARVGVLTDQQWADDVAQRLKDDFGPRALDAIGPWRADRGTTDLVMLDILAQARRRVPVAVLSNTTDAFRTDLIHHGIINLFDGIFPSAELRVDKPSPLAYLTAAQRMNIAPDQLYYCDDEPSFVAGARDAGLQAKLFTNPADFAQSLTQLGIPIQLN